MKQSAQPCVQPQLPQLLTAEQLAQLLQMSLRSIRRKASDGELPPPIRLGRLTRWRRDVIESWLANDCR